jgi:tRNA A37 threonylcarbamoyladenosine modification protein TsaB
MYTLALDTTSTKTRLAILKKDELLFEREWKSNANETETVTKTIKTASESIPMLLSQIKKVVAIQGPGTLNGTRTGITMANTARLVSGCEIVGYKSFDWWKKRTNPDQQKQKPHLILKITEHEIFVDGKQVMFEAFAKEMKKRKTPFVAFGEMTPTQHHALKHFASFQWIDDMSLKTFGQVMKEMKGGRGKKGSLSPVYAKEPKITAAKKKTRYI